MNDTAIVQWLLADGDFMLFLVRMLVMIFGLQFVTGMTYILTGVRNSCL